MTKNAPHSQEMTEASWTPSEQRVKTTQLSVFSRNLEQKTGCSFAGYQDLWQWSVENLESFWDAVWDYCEVIGEKGEAVIRDPHTMTGGQFFPDGRLNFAENLLRRRDNAPAIIFCDEKGKERTLTFLELYQRVSQLQQVLKNSGIQEGDRVAGYMPNMPETIIACLAAASLGAIWSSASPDFGAQGLLDRFGQIEPKILITVDGYFYNGKTIDCLSKVREVAPKIPSLERVLVVSFAAANSDISDIKGAEAWDSALQKYQPEDIIFNRVDFNHPLFIMFSSGTTGIPKCIVHGHGGTLLQHVKEHRLQNDIQKDDKVFYFTTCGWMMWNWLISALASEATLLLFDGSPFYPDGNVLWDFTTRHNCTLFGTSAKYIDTMKVNDLQPSQTHNLQSLKVITSTGSPLVHESFDYIYDSIKKDLHVASISGGTDIVSCFMLGNPISPVYRGEIQGPGLGMAIDVFDEDGKPISAGAGSGELVCTKPFPCMPVMFWNDPDGAKYKSAYFERFDNIWVHGDWIERTQHNGFIIHGRSDATLNPGGVRIGTSEIYRQVEQVDQVVESIAVGQDWDGDVRVILFVILHEGETLQEDLTKTIKQRIRAGASPRHVPAKIIEVTDIPRTKSGKITELAVRDMIMGRPIKNKEALANPDALNQYADCPELQEA